MDDSAEETPFTEVDSVLVTLTYQEIVDVEEDDTDESIHQRAQEQVGANPKGDDLHSVRLRAEDYGTAELTNDPGRQFLQMYRTVKNNLSDSQLNELFARLQDERNRRGIGGGVPPTRED